MVYTQIVQRCNGYHVSLKPVEHILLNLLNSVGSYVSKCGSVGIACSFLTPMFNLKKNKMGVIFF